LTTAAIDRLGVARASTVLTRSDFDWEALAAASDCPALSMTARQEAMPAILQRAGTPIHVSSSDPETVGLCAIFSTSRAVSETHNSITAIWRSRKAANSGDEANDDRAVEGDAVVEAAAAAATAARIADFAAEHAAFAKDRAAYAATTPATAVIRPDGTGTTEPDSEAVAAAAPAWAPPSFSSPELIRTRNYSQPLPSMPC